jgi:hypothetical protein
MFHEALMKIGNVQRKKGDDPTAEKLRKLFPVCQVCQQSTRDHRYMQLAVSFNESSIARLFGLVRNHEWEELVTVDEWNPLANVLVVYAILGPHESGFVATVKSPYELYEADEVCTTEPLAAEDIQRLEVALGTKEWGQL